MQKPIQLIQCFDCTWCPCVRCSNELQLSWSIAFEETLIILRSNKFEVFTLNHHQFRSIYVSSICFIYSSEIYTYTLYTQGMRTLFAVCKAEIQFVSQYVHYRLCIFLSLFPLIRVKKKKICFLFSNFLSCHWLVDCILSHDIRLIDNISRNILLTVSATSSVSLVTMKNLAWNPSN